MVVAKTGVVQPKTCELSTLCVPMSNVASAGLKCVVFRFPLLVQLKALSISLCGEMVLMKNPESLLMLFL